MLLSDSVSEEDRQLSIDDTPVLPSASPFLRNIHHGQIKHLKKAVVGRKDRSGFGYLPELTVEALYGVGGIDQPAYLLRILEIGTQIRPVIPP